MSENKQDLYNLKIETNNNKAEDEGEKMNEN